jgi:TPR repeat protein
MVPRLFALALAVAVGQTGCVAALGSATCAIVRTRHSPPCTSFRDQVEADGEAEQREAWKADREARNEGNERDARTAAAPACQRGDARACLTVAVYDERHRAARAVIAREYGVACRGEIALGCLRLAAFAEEPAVANASLARGCELGEIRACSAAAEAMPDRAGAFYEAGCQLDDFDACASAAFAYLHAAGARFNRVHALALAVRGCDHRSERSCALRDEARAAMTR